MPNRKNTNLKPVTDGYTRPLHVIAQKKSETGFKLNRYLIADGQNPSGVESKIDKQRRIENGGIENQNGFEKMT